VEVGEGFCLKYVCKISRTLSAIHRQSSSTLSITANIGKIKISNFKKTKHDCSHLFNFRGVAASFRLKHLFLCNSLVYHVGAEWQEFFYPQLIAWVHYVPVETHLLNVECVVNSSPCIIEPSAEISSHSSMSGKTWLGRLRNGTAWFKWKIDCLYIHRGRDFVWRHLRQEDISCYWRRLLRRYAKLLDFEIVKDETLMLRTNDMIRQK